MRIYFCKKIVTNNILIIVITHNSKLSKFNNKLKIYDYCEANTLISSKDSQNVID